VFFFKKGSPYVIFAFGDTSPAAGADISYDQSNMGFKVLNLISGPKRVSLNEPNLEVVSYTLQNVSIFNET
jgi:hypothetical protein